MVKDINLLILKFLLRYFANLYTTNIYNISINETTNNRKKGLPTSTRKVESPKGIKKTKKTNIETKNTPKYRKIMDKL